MLTAVAAALVLTPAKYTMKTLAVKVKDQYEAKLQYPEFSSNSAVAQLANKEALKFVKSQFGEFEQFTKEFFSEEGSAPSEWYHEAYPTISVANDSVISIIWYQYDYSGGAHPNRFYTSRTVVSTGKNSAEVFEFKDLFINESAEMVFRTTVLSSLVEKERTSRMGEPTEMLTLTPEQCADFVLTPSGIAFMFQPYAVGSYVEGEYMVKMKWSELSQYVKPMLAKAVQK
ncbi:MAG: DUF4163 domain-containing protein [Fimbriimonadaceae bacterium]